MQPGGHLVVTTINRTAASFGAAILGAEYVLRMVPAGTHEWAKFVTPAELREGLAARGLAVTAGLGLKYDPVTGAWAVSTCQAVNFAIVGQKPAGVGVTTRAISDAPSMAHTAR